MKEYLERGAFLFFLVAVTILFLTLLWPFFTPILWAIVLSILFHPLSDWFAALFGGRRFLAVTVALLCILALVVVVLFGVGTLVANEAASLYYRLASQDAGYYLNLVEQQPLVERALHFFNIEEGELRSRIIEVGQSGTAWIASQLFNIGSNAASFVLDLFIMLYLVFVLLRSGEDIKAHIIRALPLEHDKSEFLFSRFGRTIHALFRGTLIVALAQGTVGGILFAIAGVPNALLWAIMMCIFALVPAVGPAVVWLPTGLILLATGNISGALIVLIGGALIVGLLDNFLRPLLIGRDLEMSDALVMLSIISGLLAFGPSGIVIGPVVAALFLAAWSLFEKEYQSSSGGV